MVGTVLFGISRDELAGRSGSDLLWLRSVSRVPSNVKQARCGSSLKVGNIPVGHFANSFCVWHTHSSTGFC
jgi:hypothetical protein